MKSLGLEVKSSAYYQRIQELVTYLEKIYKDFSEKSKRENLEEYYTMLIEKIKRGAKAFLDIGMNRAALFLVCNMPSVDYQCSHDICDVIMKIVMQLIYIKSFENVVFNLRKSFT